MSDTRHMLGLGDDPDADIDLIHDCQQRLLEASLALHHAAASYVADATPGTTEHLVRAAQRYAGRQADLAFVQDERRTPTTIERH